MNSKELGNVMNVLNCVETIGATLSVKEDRAFGLVKEALALLDRIVKESEDHNAYSKEKEIEANIVRLREDELHYAGVVREMERELARQGEVYSNSLTSYRYNLGSVREQIKREYGTLQKMHKYAMERAYGLQKTRKLRLGAM